jgi:hypothetical protein
MSRIPQQPSPSLPQRHLCFRAPALRR